MSASDKIKKLERKVKELEAKVAELEKRTDDKRGFQVASWLLVLLEIAVGLISLINHFLG